jgi:hypothetical protein
MKFQEKIFHNSLNFRIKYPAPPYPAYHTGLYLEEYFCKRFINECLKENIDRIYLPIFWTNIYQKRWLTNTIDNSLQYFLDGLPRDLKYFTVSQHDDAPLENLDGLDISVYSAGGNYSKGIAIPLVCSPIKVNQKNNKVRNILCSFIGSNTHSVREKLINCYKDEDQFVILDKNWTYNVDKKDLDVFIDTTLNSVFSLCPRGYGKQSFRFYEALQLGSIPVYIYDENPYLPFSDKIDYNSFCILISCKDIKNLKNIIQEKSELEIKFMVDFGKIIYENFFTLDKVFDNIMDNVKSGK